MSESYKRRETARDIIVHRGNSCVTAENLIETIEQSFRRFYSN